MTISYVGAASAASNTVNLPTFQIGDFAIVIAGRDTAGSSPTVPSGWTSYATITRGVVGYRFLQAGDSSTDTWTNAEMIGVVIYRGVNTDYPIDSNRRCLLGST